MRRMWQVRRNSALNYFFAYGYRTAAFYVGLPIAGWLLSSEELGKFFYLLAIINIASIGSTLGLGSYITRKAYNSRILAYIFGSAMLVVTFAHGSALVVVFGTVAAWWLVTLVSWVRGCAVLAESYLIASGSQRNLISLNFLHGSCYLVSALVLVSLFRRADALLVSMAIADIPLIAVAVWRSVRASKARIANATLTEHFRPWLKAVWRGFAYGAPILLASLANVGLNSLDRFVVKHFLGYAELAVFSMMYTLAFAGNRFVVQPVNQLSAQAYMSDQASPRAQQLIRRRSAIGLSVIILFVLLCGYFGNFVLGLIGSSFHVDPLNYALVGLSSIFGLGFAVCSLPMKRTRSTVAFSLRLSSAAVMNVFGSFLLVPRFGILGASVATYAAYATLFLSTWIGRDEKLVDDNVLLACLMLGLVLVVTVQ